MPDVLRLRCSDLAHHADLLPRAGIDEDAFRHHSHDALDPDDEQDRCFCYDGGGDPDAWDAENRREANRRCNAPVTVARPGFELVLCCRCFSESGADRAKLAEVGCLVAAAERQRWRVVPGSGGRYEVSRDGLIRSVALPGSKLSGRVLRPARHPRTGHLHVQLALPDVPDTTTAKVHHVVLSAFVGPCQRGMQCRHLNGNPADNRLENLRWGTPQQNSDDTLRHGRRNRGSRNGNAALTEEMVREIRRRRAAGETCPSIAADLPVSYKQVWNVAVGRSWAHVRGDAATAGVSHEESLCEALARSLDMLAEGRPIAEVNKAGRVLRGEA